MNPESPNSIRRQPFHLIPIFVLLVSSASVISAATNPNAKILMPTMRPDTASGFERVFEDQTELPVYRIGVEGFWTHNAYWGTQACALSPKGDAFAVRALDLKAKISYVFVLEADGTVRHQWEAPQDITRLAPSDATTKAGGRGRSPYHGGDVFWSQDGCYIYGQGLGFGRDAITGAFREEPLASDRMRARFFAQTQMAAMDAGEPPSLSEEAYGIFVERDGERVLVLSVAELRERRAQLHPEWEPLPDTPIDVIGLRWSADGKRFQFNLGNHVPPAGTPRVREVWVAEADLSSVRPVIPHMERSAKAFVNHSSFHYPSGRWLTGASKTGVVLTDLVDGSIRYFRTGLAGGHPSLSPDGKWIISDSYRDVGTLFLINVQTGECHELLKVPRRASGIPDWWKNSGAPKGKGPRYTDLHPNWSADGTKVTFNAMFGPHSQVCMINLESIVRP